jgi:hypothetical protein
MKTRKLLLGLLLVAPGIAHAACCYFAAKEKDIDQPGQKAFLTWDEKEKIESFTVQPRFAGNALDFGMVIPTPGKPKLDEMPRDFFKDLAIYTILLPLPEQIYLEKPDTGWSLFGGSMPRAKEDALPMPATRPDHGVKVLEYGVVGSLDYKIIVAEDASGLYAWLKENDYSFGGTEEALDFYLKKKWFFTVMKIDSKAMKKNPDGSYIGEVTPTRFTFESPECVYPLKITQISVKDQTDALFYVESAHEMDLRGDFSWMHSWRVMYLTYVLGCSATDDELKEIEDRNRWIQAKKTADPRFETTKLEWAHQLGEAEISVLEDPLANFAQMGSRLPRGAIEMLTHGELMAVAKDKLGDDESRLREIDRTYASNKGKAVKCHKGLMFLSEYMWFPNREAPDEDVKGLTRLKGHLRKGKWLTKFRKVLRKDEMTDDLVLVPVSEAEEQDYVRILPTSPP